MNSRDEKPQQVKVLLLPPTQDANIAGLQVQPACSSIMAVLPVRPPASLCSTGQVRIGLGPGGHKLSEPGPGTLDARPMSGSQSRGFVQEKQFGVFSRGHNLPAAAFELKLADDPAFQLIRADNMALIIVETTSIAHQRASGWGGNNVAKGSASTLS